MGFSCVFSRDFACADCAGVAAKVGNMAELEFYLPELERVAMVSMQGEPEHARSAAAVLRVYAQFTRNDSATLSECHATIACEAAGRHCRCEGQD